MKYPVEYTTLRVMAAKVFFMTRLANNALLAGKPRTAQAFMRKISVIHQQAHTMESQYGNEYVDEHYWIPVFRGLENINSKTIRKMSQRQEAS